MTTNFVVWEETPKEEVKTVRLRLISKPSGIVLAIVDKDGGLANRGSILSVTRDGQISFHSSINPDLGFQLDDRGRVKVF